LQDQGQQWATYDQIVSWRCRLGVFFTISESHEKSDKTIGGSGFQDSRQITEKPEPQQLGQKILEQFYSTLTQNGQLSMKHCGLSPPQTVRFNTEGKGQAAQSTSVQNFPQGYPR